jgi:cobalt/nickel transport system permease protein
MLWAVHIGNEVLTGRWELGGFALAAVLLTLGAWRFHPDDVPRAALLTAAFFVASSMHVPLGPASVHLLLNGLVGVLLGWQCVPAIFVGLLLQAVLLNHGGFSALGVNTCIQTIPALVACAVFRSLHRIAWRQRPTARSLLVAASVAAWILSGLGSVSLLVARTSGESGPEAFETTTGLLANPSTLAVTLALAGGGAWLERRAENAPEFPLGLSVGLVSVLLTVALACGVLMAGGAYFGATPPLILAVAHLPVAAVEGIVLGVTVGFLARVKPEMLGPVAARDVGAGRGDDASLGLRREHLVE